MRLVWLLVSVFALSLNVAYITCFVYSYALSYQYLPLKEYTPTLNHLLVYNTYYELWLTWINVYYDRMWLTYYICELTALRLHILTSWNTLNL